VYGYSEQAGVLNMGAMTDTITEQRVAGSGLTRLIFLPRTFIPQKSSFADRTSDLALILHLAALNYYNGTYVAAECVLY